MSAPDPSGSATIAVERVLARARVLLSVTSLVLTFLDPTQPSRWATAAYGFLLLYAAGSVWLVVALRKAQHLPPRAPLAAHLVDILWLAVLTSVTGAPSSPLLPFLTLVVMSGAYRWGAVGTAATTAAVCVLLFVDGVALTSFGSGDPNLGFELNRFIVLAACTTISGVLLAYLASYHKQLHIESASIAWLLARLRSETGLDSALEIAANDLLRMFGAKSLAIAVRETHTDESVAWMLSSSGEGHFRRVRLSPRDVANYLFEANAAFALTRRGDGVRMTLAIDATGAAVPVSDAAIDPPDTPFVHALVATMSFHDQWFGRVFLFDPDQRHRGLNGLRLLHRVTTSITPALHSIYLIRRLRSRAGAAERARIARDLHDTSIQSLIGVEMELLALSRRTADKNLGKAVADIQSRLRTEIKALRQLIVPATASTDAAALTERLTETLGQFQIESGVRARFLSVGSLSVPGHLGREILLLVHAALSNVKRHSRATWVDVTLERDRDGWLLVIEDDGGGFTDGGRFGDRVAATTPWSMRERVSALGGQLVVESRDGPGVRLEVRLPSLVAAE
jgi:signal transduction histidine kinase